jgi:hypothetical protein
MLKQAANSTSNGKKNRRRTMFWIKHPLTALGLFLALCIMAPAAGYSQTTKPPADVKVTNSSAEPVPTRDVDNSARQPFTVGLVSFNNNTFQVPAGKRLVIEYVSGRGVLVQGLTYVQVALQFGAAIDGNVVGIAHRFVPVRLGQERA